MRALRDFNIPKIVTDDIPVFMGLIGDLFPSIDVPRKRSSDFEKLIRKSALELNLEAEDGFVLKVTKLNSKFPLKLNIFSLALKNAQIYAFFQNQKLCSAFSSCMVLILS